MANRLVRLVKSAALTVSLATLVACNSPTEYNYSSSVSIPERNTDVAGFVINPIEDTYIIPEKTSQYDPCRDGSLKECLNYGVSRVTKVPDQLLPWFLIILIKISCSGPI